MRNLILILGDQLNRSAPVFEGFDKDQDCVWMAEVTHEAKHVWSHKQRIALFLSAMRHFRDARKDEGLPIHYTALDSQENLGTFDKQLAKDLTRLKPQRVLMTEPGEWRVLETIKTVCRNQNIPLAIHTDTHFYTTVDDFAQHARGRKALRMEFFYREQRKRFDVLMDQGEPIGGAWNFDKDNRGSFGKKGPEVHTRGPQFSPDAITQDILQLVEKHFSTHPGSLESFAWPVTPEQAESALADFIENRLPNFGQYQDALWTEEPWLFHSWISSSLNLKLIDPRTVVRAAENAYHQGHAPLAAVEGFIRQILGWREYVRGIYWTKMPDYLELNTMDAREPLPDFYWTAHTELTCLQQTLQQTLEHGYAHHIQRLMVTGLYALLLGVHPKALHEWYLAVYVDAVEWVELPNTLGMSQYGDGGLMASKPYIASGSYIQKMSNYCKHCPKDPKKKVGPDACPFTTLYWDYLLRHQDRLKSNHRMSLQLKNLGRLSDEDKRAIQTQAAKIRSREGVRSPVNSASC